MALAGVCLVSGCSSAPKTGGLPAREGAVERGMASWYGQEFAGLPTASGEIFDPARVSAAHRTLPLGTLVEVTNEKNGLSVSVPINDRGPFIAGRILDLSRAAAEALGAVIDGVVPVSIRVLALGDNSRRPSGPPVSAWVVQAGAFSSEENAVKVRDLLSRSYPNPYLERYLGLLRVKFGPYEKRQDAEEARESLGTLGLAGIVLPLQ